MRTDKYKDIIDWATDNESECRSFDLKETLEAVKVIEKRRVLKDILDILNEGQKDKSMVNPIEDLIKIAKYINKNY